MYIPLAGDGVDDEAKVNDRAACMSKVLVVVVGNIGECEQVQLTLAATTSRIDGEQDGPGNQTAHETAYDRDLEKSQEQVAVEGVVVQDVRIGRGPELRDPIDKAIFGRRGSLLISQ